MKTLIVVIATNFWLAKCSVPPWHPELFGDGLIMKRDREQHISSSTSDLLILFETERKLVKMLSDQMASMPKNVKSMVGKYLKETKFLQTNITSEEYVFHPVNTFHMLKRASKWFPILKENVPSLQLTLTIPTESEVTIGSAHGLADIQEHYNFKVDDLIQGKIVDPITGRVYKSEQRLTSVEALLMAKEAVDVRYLEGAVLWLKGALKAAKSEKKPKGMVDRIKSQLKLAVEDHDNELKMRPSLLEQGPFSFLTRETMFKPPKGKSGSSDEIILDESVFHDLEEAGNVNLLGREELKERYQQKLNRIYRRKIQKLCRGKFQRPAEQDKDLKCFFVKQDNPYLRLGPFKYELLNKEPEVGLFHQLASKSQIEAVIQNATPYLKPTPYSLNQKTMPYSKLRTSKVMYQNEFLWQAAMQVSNNIQNATGFQLYKTPYDSENYQVMNYGLGGKISGHWDISSQSSENSADATIWGGRRLVTMMTYLTDVELGGRTVFPQLGLSVKPEAGSTLYWFSIGPHDNIDSRALHLGCPVLFGNKWIANKWVKWIAQQRKLPCSKESVHFSLFDKKEY